MLRWAEKFDVAVPMPLARMRVLMEGRASVRTALEREGLSAAHDPKGAVRENREEHRFERSIHDGSIAAAYYKEEDGKVAFLHMETPTEFSDLGIATELARGALDLLRASGRKAILKCAFMEHFFATHPEYGDVVAG